MVEKSKTVDGKYIISLLEEYHKSGRTFDEFKTAILNKYEEGNNDVMN